MSTRRWMQESKQVSPRTSHDPGGLAGQRVGKDVETETGNSPVV